jgi:hypothetical protein
MGGNAIEGACRISRSEYDRVESMLIEKINGMSQSLYPRSIKFYSEKQDFGDIDLIISSSGKINAVDIAKSFHADQIKKNGNVVSFGLRLDKERLFQVDLISVPFDDLEISSFYFSYNDLNLLCGRIAHKLGVSFGFDGLKFKMRTESGYKGMDFILSKDPESIYRFLGLDYNRYEQGFKNLEEIYQFVASSKYFNPSIFDFDQLNHINKTRNRKRSTYAGFLKWIEDQGVFNLNNYQFQEKGAYLVKVDHAFPNCDLFGRMKEYSEEFKYHLSLKEKFNGAQIMSEYGFQGKQLGQVMESFKKWILGITHFPDFDYYIEWTPKEIIKKDFELMLKDLELKPEKC